MKRSSIEKGRTTKIWKAHNSIVHGNEDTGCICDRQRNRFRKGQKQAGCGKPGCVICHIEKIFHIPTLQDIRNQLTMKEGLQEIGEVS